MNGICLCGPVIEVPGLASGFTHLREPRFQRVRLTFGLDLEGIPAMPIHAGLSAVIEVAAIGAFEIFNFASGGFNR